MKFFYLIIIFSVSFSSCTVIKRDSDNISYKKHYVKEVIPKQEKYSKYGNPETYNVFGKRYKTLKTHVGYAEEGIASWYGKKFHGRLTSTREVYDMYELTAAHKSLPIPCYVKVTNLSNNSL